MKKCPNCNNLTFGTFDNLIIGPAIYKQCSHCGAKISTPYYSLVPIGIFLITFFAFLIILPSPINWILCATSCVGTFYRSWKKIPLIVKNK